jgi:membrane fusion protein, multidrug efflux system
VEAAKAAIVNNRRQGSLQDSRIDRAAAGIDQANAQIAAAQAGKEAVQADVLRTQEERTRQEALLNTHSTTQQKVETAIADERRLAAQAASREADLTQARTLLHSNELAVEAEKRSKSVLESQGMQLLADLHAKQAGLAVAQVNLGYTKILAPADGTVGERQVRPGQLVSPGTQVITFVENTRWVQANFRETQLTNIRIGDTAEIRIDVYPGQVIQGKVLQIAPASGSQFALLPPDNATGNFTKVVQRVPVKISLDSSALTSELRPGLSAVVKVRIRK